MMAKHTPDSRQVRLVVFISYITHGPGEENGTCNVGIPGGCTQDQSEQSGPVGDCSIERVG